MEFMINNNVDFTRDPVDHMYVATIKIVNKLPYQAENGNSQA